MVSQNHPRPTGHDETSMSEGRQMDATPASNWRTHRVGDLKPCRICGQPAFMRDADGRPCHKVCADAQAVDQ